jgi:hypothetical protein
MSQTFNRLATWSVDKRWTVLLVMALISGVALIGYLDPKLLLSLFDRTEEMPVQSTANASTTTERPPDVEPIPLLVILHRK